MTTANKITLIRILMIPAFVLMAIYYGESIKRGQPLEWQRYAAIVIFLVAAVSDGLDGYIARRYNQKSALGVILDPIADKGLLLSGIITLSISNWSNVDPQYGRFPAWFPVLVISRDAVIVIGSAVLASPQRQGARATDLDREGRDLSANGGDRLGDVTTHVYPAHLRRRGGGIFHLRLRNHLRDGWLSSARGAGARQRERRAAETLGDGRTSQSSGRDRRPA